MSNPAITDIDTALTADSVEAVDVLADDNPIRVVASAIRPLGVVAIALQVTDAYEMHWGDGTYSGGSGSVPLNHTYPAASVYTITVRQGDTVVAQRRVNVRNTMKPVVTFAPNADNPNFIEATFDDDPADVVSQYRIRWEEGQEETLFAPKGTVRRHGFPAGTHEIFVQDLHTGRSMTESVEVTDPEYDPDFSLARGADTNTADLTITKLATVKEVLIDWGDGKQSTISAPAVGTKSSHTYTANNTYIIQLVYSDGSTDGSSRVVTIPFVEAASGAGEQR